MSNFTNHPNTVPPDPNWSKHEKWAWSMILNGKPADFTNPEEADNSGFKLDPENGKYLALSSEFIESILTDENFSKSISQKGVEIVGAAFDEDVDLESAFIPFQFSLENCCFSKDLNLNNLKSEWSISLSKSTFKTKLHMNSIEVKNSLFMSGGAIFKEVDLRHARIGGTLDMSSSIFEGKLNMNSIRVESNLLMRGKAAFKEINLIAARIGDTLDMDGSSFEEKVDMNRIIIESSLYMRGEATFNEVELTSSRIGGQLDMSGSLFKKKIDMNNIQLDNSLFIRRANALDEIELKNGGIGGQLYLSDSTFEKGLNIDTTEIFGTVSIQNSIFNSVVRLLFAKLHDTLDLSGSELSSIDLTGTSIAKELRLGSNEHTATIWKGSSIMKLRNVYAGTIQDLPDAWPEHLILDGFTYNNLGGYGSDNKFAFADRPANWMKNWLNKQSDYSPQPFHQLGKVLNGAGYKTMSRRVLFSGKKREIQEAKSFRKIGLFMSMITVGFGYYNAIALIWVAILTTIGFFVIQGEDAMILNKYLIHSTIDKVFFSLDLLLPIIKLQGSHYEIQLTGGIKYYFYCQQIMGYILASFLVAGLSGITKK